MAEAARLSEQKYEEEKEAVCKALAEAETRLLAAEQAWTEAIPEALPPRSVCGRLIRRRRDGYYAYGRARTRGPRDGAV